MRDAKNVDDDILFIRNKDDKILKTLAFTYEKFMHADIIQQQLLQTILD